MRDKCYNCDRLKEHSFNQCLSENCLCSCVEQIRKLYTNSREDEIKESLPPFMKISHPEMMALPNREHEIRNFNHIDKNEWLKPKKKRKNKNITNHFGH